MFCCCSMGPPTLTLVFLPLKHTPHVPGSALRYNLSPNQKGGRAKKKKHPEVEPCTIKPLGNQLNTQKAVFKRKLSAINRVQLSSCVPGQRLLLLLMAIQLFLRKLSSTNFSPVSQCLLTLQLCFSLILFTLSKLTGFCTQLPFSCFRFCKCLSTMLHAKYKYILQRRCQNKFQLIFSSV